MLNYFFKCVLFRFFRTFLSTGFRYHNKTCGVKVCESGQRLEQKQCCLLQAMRLTITQLTSGFLLNRNYTVWLFKLCTWSAKAPKCFIALAIINDHSLTHRQVTQTQFPTLLTWKVWPCSAGLWLLVTPPELSHGALWSVEGPPHRESWESYRTRQRTWGGGGCWLLGWWCCSGPAVCSASQTQRKEPRFWRVSVSCFVRLVESVIDSVNSLKSCSLAELPVHHFCGSFTSCFSKATINIF